MAVISESSTASGLGVSTAGLRGVSCTLRALAGLGPRARQLKHKPPTRHRLDSGPRSSRQRGRGMTFAETRVYLPGDDIRTMDWRVTARTGRPHTKVFHEERERPVFVLADLGPSMQFGTQVAFKSVVAAEAAALLAFAAMEAGDRVGGVVFAGEAHHALRPMGGRRGVFAVLRALAQMNKEVGREPGPGNHPQEDSGAGGEPQLQGEGSDYGLDGALTRARQLLRPGSVVYVLSDLWSIGEHWRTHLSELRRHNDVVLGWIRDRLELTPPPPGRYPIRGLGIRGLGSSGVGEETLTLTLDRAHHVRRYQEILEHRAQEIATATQALRIPIVHLSPGRDVAADLSRVRLG